MTTFLKPPQAVIYTYDMEPITVVDMKPGYWDFLLETGAISFAVLPPLRIDSIWEQPDITVRARNVTIRAHKIVRGDGAKYLMLTTNDEDNALLMKPSFLPGQQSALNEERKKAFAKGFLHALNIALGDK